MTFKWPNAECLSFELVFDITHLSSFQSHRKCFFSKAALHKVSSGSGWGIGHELSLSLQTQHFYCHEGRSFISVLLSFLSVITINHPTWLVSSVFSSLSANDSPVHSVQLPFFLLQDCLFLFLFKHLLNNTPQVSIFKWFWICGCLVFFFFVLSSSLVMRIAKQAWFGSFTQPDVWHVAFGLMSQSENKPSVLPGKTCYALDYGAMHILISQSCKLVSKRTVN